MDFSFLIDVAKNLQNVGNDINEIFPQMNKFLSEGLKELAEKDPEKFKEIAKTLNDSGMDEKLAEAEEIVNNLNQTLKGI